MRNILLICILIVIKNSSFAQSPIIDGIVEKKLMKEKRVLPYPKVREADIFWEKRIWRVIDVREKMNLTFSYPEAPFFEILKEAAMNGEAILYSTHDDKFTEELSDYEGIFYKTDTVEVIDPITYEVRYQAVLDEVDASDIKRYRIKEVWYFDEATATMKVRILGIAPLKDVYDENGNFRYEQPLFWVYYPHVREMLARQEVFIPGNDYEQISWEDLFEMRYFSSVIFKESNIYDRRIEHYKSGVYMLLEADKIKQELFNFEHDLWSY